MSVALIAHAAIASPGSSHTPTLPVDTTGATILIGYEDSYGGPGGVQDSKSNAWTALTTQQTGSEPSTRMYYAANPAVGSGHTLTPLTGGGSSGFTGLVFAAFSGVATTSPFDVENGAVVASGATSLASGAITPANNGSLIVFGFGSNSGTPNSASGGLSKVDEQFYAGGVCEGASLFWLEQTTAASINVTGTVGSGGGALAASIAAFKPAAGGTAYTLAAASGSYAVTGQAAKLTATRALQATAGSYLISGVAARLTATRKLTLVPGSYATTGAATKNNLTRVLGAAPGGYTINGAAIGATATRKMSAVAGAYSLNGTATKTFRQITLAAAPGSYFVTGAAAGLTLHHAYILQAAPGSYSIAGSGAILTNSGSGPTATSDIYPWLRRQLRR